MSERTSSTGFVRRPGAERLIGAPRRGIGSMCHATLAVHQ
jgi:hypothetical protein